MILWYRPYRWHSLYKLICFPKKSAPGGTGFHRFLYELLKTVYELGETLISAHGDYPRAAVDVYCSAFFFLPTGRYSRQQLRHFHFLQANHRRQLFHLDQHYLKVMLRWDISVSGSTGTGMMRKSNSKKQSNFLPGILLRMNGMGCSWLSTYASTSH